MWKHLLSANALLGLAALVAAVGCHYESAASPSTAPTDTVPEGRPPRSAAPAEPASSAKPAVASDPADSAAEPTASEATDEAVDEGPAAVLQSASRSTEAVNTDTGGTDTGGTDRGSAAFDAERIANGQTDAQPPNDPAPPADRATRLPPKADRAPRRPGEASKITFEDLFLNMPADVVYRPFMLSERAKELDGERVRLTGYMHSGVSSSRGIKEFVLLRNTECKFGPGGQADHLAQVYLRQGNTTEFTPNSLFVEGTLKIEPYQGPDGNTWSIYRLTDAVLK